MNDEYTKLRSDPAYGSVPDEVLRQLAAAISELDRLTLEADAVGETYTTPSGRIKPHPIARAREEVRRQVVALLKLATPKKRPPPPSGGSNPTLERRRRVLNRA